MLRRVLAGCAAVFLVNSASADEKLDTLTVGTITYSNVTVLNKTRTDVWISHPFGTINLKVQDMDLDTQARLGYEVPEDKKNKPFFKTPEIFKAPELSVDPRIKEAQDKVFAQAQARVAQADPRLLYAAAGAALVCWLVFCALAGKICKKVGHKPGPLIFLPLFQWIPLIRAANMPGWWFVMFLLPGLNAIAYITWCFKIAKAREKSPIAGVFLLLPVTNIFAFLYLAFSAGQGDEALSGSAVVSFKDSERKQAA